MSSGLGEIRPDFWLDFSYHSLKIENPHITYHDTREIFEHDGVTGYTGDLRTLFEIRNAKEAAEFVLAAFGRQQPLDEAFVLELQRRLCQNTYDSRRYQLGERPGRYKLHDYVTGEAEIGASPADTPTEMAELLGEIGELTSKLTMPAASLEPVKALTAAAYFHAKFENIHPFADGNGRTGRLVMNYLLLLLDHPPIIIFDEDKKSYYEALEAWDADQDLQPLLTCLQAMCVKSWPKLAASSGAC